MVRFVFLAISEAVYLLMVRFLFLAISEAVSVVLLKISSLL
jgi:hypothetical protein